MNNVMIMRKGGEAISEIFANYHHSIPSVLKSQCVCNWSKSPYQKQFTYKHNSNSTLLLADHVSQTLAISHWWLYAVVTDILDSHDGLCVKPSF